MDFLIDALLQGITVAILVFGVTFVVGLAVIFVLWYLENRGRQ